MPVLSPETESPLLLSRIASGESPIPFVSPAHFAPVRKVRSAPGLLGSCANPGCRSGWLHVLRSRSTPVFEGGWNCSAECTRVRIEAALRREMDGRGMEGEGHRHRIPLGLVMLEQGWITAEQLRQAMAAQRQAGGGRLGYWLVRRQGVDERMVTRALGLQWSCPVLAPEIHDAEALSALVPRLFLDAFRILPLRLGGGRMLYLGFEDRLDQIVALAIERMAGLRVESGIVDGSAFRKAHSRMLGTAFAPAELIEAASQSALAATLTAAIEKVRPAQSRLVRVHDCLWLRMWRRPSSSAIPDRNSILDLICSVGAQ